MDQFVESQPKKEKLLRSATLAKGCYDPKNYEFDESFKPCDPSDPLSVHTTFEMLECLEKNKDIELDAKVIGLDKNQEWKSKRVDKTSFLESFKNDFWKDVKFKESNLFATDYSPNSGVGFGIGQDFTPLLGGPFFKNLYYYQDYIRMHSEAFYAYHHDPIAKAFIEITKNFVIGTGWEVHCDTSTPKGKVAMATWKAFEEANDLSTQIDQCCDELGIYGEVMFWKLPNNQAKIIFRLRQGDTIPLGVIPRVRLIDPSNIVEIVTYPEDITRPLFYVWLTPTQWQMFQGGVGEGRPVNQASTQPSLKFIYRTIMADQMLHFKVNAVSNEKRGRSDYFPILSYLKRMRDIVDYQLIALQKNAAWALDTTIKGDQTDIDSYISDQASLGTVPPAGSEFVHSEAIERKYIANVGAGEMKSDAFNIALSMSCAGMQIPVSWMGTHLSGGQTKASAFVGTEPVIKKMEKRREVIRKILIKLWDFCMTEAGLTDIPCEVVFPELITQDRSQKLKDLALCENQRWFSPRTVATIAAKEFQLKDFNYDLEISDMKKELPEIPMPLTAPPMSNPSSEPGTTSGVTSEDKADAKYADTHL
jgi:hypothetical protein